MPPELAGPPGQVVSDGGRGELGLAPGLSVDRVLVGLDPAADDDRVTLADAPPHAVGQPGPTAHVHPELFAVHPVSGAPIEIALGRAEPELDSGSLARP